MEPVGTIQPVIPVTVPVPSAPSGNDQPVTLPDPAPAASAGGDQVSLSTPVAQQQPAQPKVEYANPQVLGTSAVTTYMVNGQLYTRYRDELTNKVTYIPQEAQVFAGGGSSGSATPALNITA